MNEATEPTEFDADYVAGSIASDVYFLWRTSHKFKWTQTPGIMLKKVREEIAALSRDELQATLEALTLEHGARLVRNEELGTLSLYMRNIVIPIDRADSLQAIRA